MVTAIVSALTGIPVKRDIAMTGEVSLRGSVLPIGGLKEKTMAAYTAGVRKVFIPEENMKDLENIDPVAREALIFVPCRKVTDVLSGALVKVSAELKGDLCEKTSAEYPEIVPERSIASRPTASIR